MSGHKFIAAAALLLGLLTTATASRAGNVTPIISPSPDEIVLTDGSRILGTIGESRDGVVRIETIFDSSLEISIEHIASITTRNPVVMKMTDDTIITDQPLRVNNGILATESAASSIYSLDDLLVVNPEPWELGVGYNWTGHASFAFKVERGNSKIDELDYRFESYWRSLRDRYTVKLNGEFDEANNQRNADNTAIIAKYDYFLENARYWGIQARASQDKFQDIDLRFLIGPYYGVEFLTRPVFTLSGEIGASYVNETFITAEDQEYPAANWSLAMSSDYFGGDSRLYLDQLGVINLNKPSDVLLITTAGFSFPLLWGFEMAAEIVLDYDSGAVEGVEELDETYSLRLGYSW